MTKPKPSDPTPPDSTLTTRQEWLNMGGDVEMDEEEERSMEGMVVQPIPPGEKPLVPHSKPPAPDPTVESI